MRKEFLFIVTGLGIAAVLGAGARGAMAAGANPWAQINPPEGLPNAGDALNDAFQSIHIRIDSNTLQKLNAPPGTILERLGNWWLAANAWFEEHLGVSVRAIVRFIGFVFIWIAVLWIKLIQWLLSFT